MTCIISSVKITKAEAERLSYTLIVYFCI